MRKAIPLVVGGVAVVAAGVFFFSDRIGQPQTVSAPEMAAPPMGVTSDANAATNPETTPPVYGDLYSSFAKVVEAVTPAVVNVAVTAAVQKNPQMDPRFQDPLFRRFFGVPDQNQIPPQERSSGGSGVIVDATKGHIITNAHVIRDADKITVTLKDGRSFPAKVIGTDPGTDLGLLQIEGDNLTEMRIGDSTAMHVGDFVLAIGNPFGLDRTVTSGIISAIGRSGLNIEGYEDFIQTDAAINPGNSGGALVNLRGELIGINTAIIGPSGGNVGIGFAIPTAMASSVMEQLIATGKVTRGRLGVQISDLTPALAQTLNLGNIRGALVNRVEGDSPAEEAGIKAGDVVVALDKTPVGNSTNLRNRIGFIPPGQEVTVTVLRDGDERNIKVKVGEVPSKTNLATASVPKLEGAAFETTGRNTPGVRVSDVAPDSPAWRAGLRAGDVISAVNRTPIADIGELQTALESERQTALFIRRGEEEFLLII